MIYIAKYKGFRNGSLINKGDTFTDREGLKGSWFEVYKGQEFAEDAPATNEPVTYSQLANGPKPKTMIEAMQKESAKPGRAKKARPEESTGSQEVI